MIWFLVDAFVLMFVCFAVGAVVAWLLAVAIHPRADEAFTDLDVQEKR